MDYCMFPVYTHNRQMEYKAVIAQDPVSQVEIALSKESDEFKDELKTLTRLSKDEISVYLIESCEWHSFISSY